MKKKSESYIRWQGYAMNQLGYVNNLLITLLSLFFGFLITLIKEKS
jgi:hypothetical protein